MTLNRVELIGGLTRDPTVKVLDSGTVVCQFTLGMKEAVWDSAARADRVKNYYLSVVAWGDLAEYVAHTFHKGDEVYVLGALTQEEVGAEGKKESKTRVRAHVIRPVRVRQGGGTAPADQQRETAKADIGPPPF